MSKTALPEGDMKRQEDADRLFQWDLTTWVVIGFVLAFLMMLFLDVGSLGHVR